MIMELPTWLGYALMVPSFALARWPRSTSPAGTSGCWTSDGPPRRSTRVSGVTIALLLFGGMLLLMAVRVPIAMAMMVPGVVGYVAIQRLAFAAQRHEGARVRAARQLRPDGHPAVPADGRIRHRRAGCRAACSWPANAVVGHLRGGLAMAAVLACAAFGSICGSSVATAATMAKVALPEMRGDRTTPAGWPPARWPPAARWGS